MEDPNIGHVKLVRKSIGVLKPAEYNPRNITDKAKKGLSNSIDSFGLLQPIVWNKQTGNVIAGHQRLEDIIAKGATETDVIEVDFDLAKEKSANIALNHTGLAGTYDLDKLQFLLDEIGEQDTIDFNFDELLVEEVDYSVLEDDDSGADAMAKEVKTSIILTFGPDTIEEAQSLVSWWKKRDADVSAMFVEKLKQEKSSMT